MTYVVTENCIKCKYMDCVEVCPVDCFYEGENMLVIHPDECIDCGVCEPECPAEAIKPDTETGLDEWLKLNTDMSEELAEHNGQTRPAARCQRVRRQAGQARDVLVKSGRGGLIARSCSRPVRIAVSCARTRLTLRAPKPLARSVFFDFCLRS